MKRAATLVERINLRAADRVVVVSQVLRDRSGTAGVAPRKIVVNPNGVDPAQFRPDVDGTGVRRRTRASAPATSCRLLGHIRPVARHPHPRRAGAGLAFARDGAPGGC